MHIHSRVTTGSHPHGGKAQKFGHFVVANAGAFAKIAFLNCKVVFLVSFVLLMTAFGFGASAQAQAEYFYDPAGRVSGILDPSNGTSIYTYDNVGNIQKVTTKTASSLAVAGFSPPSGQANTQVTIAGTGFGTTSNTTVKFNNVAATVTSVTTNSILAYVPSGASSGSIRVVVSGVTAVSPLQFGVSSSVPPQISSVSAGSGGAPCVAAPVVSNGTLALNSVTINGSGFSSDASLDKVLIDGRFGQITAASTTQLTALVPAAAATGFVTVETTAGSAASANYLIVAPTSVACSAINSTVKTVALGGSKTTAAGGAGQVQLVVFAATLGTRAAVTITGDTGAASAVTLIAPDGRRLGPAISDCCFSNSTTGAQLLPLTGTYTIEVAQGGADAVTVATNVVPPDQTVSNAVLNTSINSPNSYTLTANADFENMVVNFAGVAGRSMSMTLAEPTAPAAAQNITIIAPDGYTQVFNSQCCGVAQNTFVGPVSLPQTGQYTITLSSATLTAIGSATFTLYDATPIIKTIQISSLANPKSQTLTSSTPGQPLQLSFTANAGRAVSLFASEPCPSGGTTGLCANGNPAQFISIAGPSPNGSTVYLNSNCCQSPILSADSSTGYLFTGEVPYNNTRAYVFATGGTYTATLSPSVVGATGTTNTGSATFTLYDATPITSANNIRLSPSTTTTYPVTLNSLNPGQFIQLQFQANAGQAVSLLTSAPCTGSGNTGLCGSDPTIPSLGIPDPAVTIAPVGNPQNAVYSSCCGEGWYIASGSSTGYEFSGEVPYANSHLYTLSQGGTYLITLMPGTYYFLGAGPTYSSMNIGSATFTLYNATPKTANINISNLQTGQAQTVPVTAVTPGQPLQLTFNGSASQGVSLYVDEPCSGSTGLCAQDPNLHAQYECLSLIGQTDGAVVYNNGCNSGPYINSTDGLFFTEQLPYQTNGTFLLPSSEPYTITLLQGAYYSTGYGVYSALTTGTANFTLYDATPVLGHASINGGPSQPVSIVDPGQAIQVGFTGTQGQTINLGITEPCSGSTGLCLADPVLGVPGQNILISGSVGQFYNQPGYVPSVSSGTGTINLNSITLSQPGPYTITLMEAANWYADRFSDYGSLDVGSATFNLTTGSQPKFTLPNGGAAVGQSNMLIGGLVPIAADGSTRNLTTSQTGQPTLLKFGATAGQTVSLLVTEDTGTLLSAGNLQELTVMSADGKDIIYSSTCCDRAPFWTGAIRTAKSGPYVIKFQAGADRGHTVHFTLYNVPANVTANAGLGASPTLLTTAVPGQSAQIKFAAKSGQDVAFEVDMMGAPDCGTAAIYGPDAQLVRSALMCGGKIDRLRSGKAPRDGTYTAVFTPGGPAVSHSMLKVAAQ